MDWHQKELKAVLTELDVPIDGLRSEEAAKRLEKYGRNELVEKGKRSLLAMFLDQFKDFMILVLSLPPWSRASSANRPTPSRSSSSSF